jgi:hypothetical protein
LDAKSFKLKKKQKKMKIDWKISLIGVILNTLFAIIVNGAPKGTLIKSGGSGSEKGLRAVVTLKDADVRGQLHVLRQELKAARSEKLLLVRDREMLDHKWQQLGKELIEIQKEYRKQNAKLRRIQLSAAAALASGDANAVGKREAQLIYDLRTVCESGRKLADRTSDFCTYVDLLLKKMPLGTVEKAKIRLRMDELRSESRKMSTLSGLEQNRRKVERCRILAVNDRLRIVVLPIGLVHGVANGLILYTGKNQNCKLQVITVRPYVSAAEVLEGNINGLSPGMVTASSREKLKN